MTQEKVVVARAPRRPALGRPSRMTLDMNGGASVVPWRWDPLPEQRLTSDPTTSFHDDDITAVTTSNRISSSMCASCAAALQVVMLFERAIAAPTAAAAAEEP